MHKLGKVAWMWPLCPLGWKEFLLVLLEENMMLVL